MYKCQNGLCLILSLDYIQQWIASSRITRDRWVWEIFIFLGLCTAVHKTLHNTLVLSYVLHPSRGSFAGHQIEQEYREFKRQEFAAFLLTYENLVTNNSLVLT